MIQDMMTQLPYILAAMVPALTLHEWGHAYTAHLFGDETPRHQGRLTLNPLAHMDLLGTLFIFLVGFGWAKPVPIDERNFRNSWAGFFVAAAGPGMNILLGVVAALGIRYQFYLLLGSHNADILIRFFKAFVTLNFALAFFNLIPVGPLDGNHILARLLPLQLRFRYRDWNLQYGGLVLLGVILVDSFFFKFGIISRLVMIPTKLLYNLIVF